MLNYILLNYILVNEVLTRRNLAPGAWDIQRLNDFVQWIYLYPGLQLIVTDIVTTELITDARGLNS